MISLHSALAREVTRTPSAPLRMIIIRPPALCLLPRRKPRPGSMVASGLLHAIAIAALLWLPRFFPEPIVAQENLSKPDVVTLNEPLILPELPRLEDRGPAPSERKH